MNDLPVFVLERVFEAPRALVWKTWTEADLLSRWYGPDAQTIIHQLDVRPGGLWLNEMKWGDNSMFERVEYTEVVAAERLVWLHSTADQDFNIAANLMMADWPLVLLTIVTFEEVGGKTNLRLTWQPHAASAAEIATFSAAIDGLGKGWGAGMDMLASILAELQN